MQAIHDMTGCTVEVTAFDETHATFRFHEAGELITVERGHLTPIPEPLTAAEEAAAQAELDEYWDSIGL